MSTLSSCNHSLLHVTSTSRRSSYNRPSSLNLSGGLTCHFLGNQKLQSLNTCLLQIVQNGGRSTKMDMKVNNDILPDIPQLPSNSDPGSWKLWLVGVFMSVIIPFWKNKWSPLQKIQQKVERVVDTAQAVTDMVEDVAEEIEKVADSLGDNLPKGKLQETALLVEEMASQTVDNINRLEEVLEKALSEQQESYIISFCNNGHWGRLLWCFPIRLRRWRTR
ncbi:uncharacterized protein LOC21396368 isoform X1 [Morus notabilis]|uniref:uncharacterized protein LOC21396368 isoform X1 n=1 Tax=Morus notabilis TaxID=981085 RepID=UPI000CED0B8E|nr:uncharacterized protein LOC21396368 isoform X1 [Morus notabilis]